MGILPYSTSLSSCLAGWKHPSCLRDGETCRCVGGSRTRRKPATSSKHDSIRKKKGGFLASWCSLLFMLCVLWNTWVMWGLCLSIRCRFFPVVWCFSFLFIDASMEAANSLQTCCPRLSPLLCVESCPIILYLTVLFLFVYSFSFHFPDGIPLHRIISFEE